jgi:hypothetical protein
VTEQSHGFSVSLYRIEDERHVVTCRGGSLDAKKAFGKGGTAEIRGSTAWIHEQAFNPT